MATIAPVSADPTITSTSKVFSDSTKKIEQIASFVFTKLSSCLSEIKEKASHFFTPLTENSWSSVEISRIGLRALALYSALGGALSLRFSAAAFLSSSPFFLVSLGFTYYSYTLVDYENPKEIAKMRAKALKLPFQETWQTHGWQQIAEHAILSPEDFFISVSQAMDNLSFPEIVSLHKQLRNEYNKYPVPAYALKLPDPVGWKYKFDADIQGKSPQDILETYSAEDLRSFRLIDEATYLRFAQIEVISTELREIERKYKSSFDVQALQIQDKLYEALSKQQEVLRKAVADKTQVIASWVQNNLLPSKEKIAELFSPEERQDIETYLSKYEQDTKTLKEELAALQANKVFRS